MFAHLIRACAVTATSRGLMATLTLSGLGASCANDSGSAPAVASPTSPSSLTSVGATELIMGTAYDSAFRRIAGAKIEIVKGPGAGLSTTSDPQGRFSLVVPGKVEDTMQIRASRDGYVTASAPPQPHCDRCHPNRWIFFYLDVLEPPVQLAGDYTLTFVAAETCPNLPEDLRSRTYQATVTPTSINYPGYPADSATSYEVTVKGPVFSDTFHTFFLNVAGTYVNVSIGDHTDPGVAERVAPNTYFAFNGSAAVTVASPVSTISTPFQGWIERCALASAIGERYDCTPATAVSVNRCEATHQMILTRLDQTAR